MDKNIIYYKTTNKYLATSLNFLGFRYYIFESETYGITEYAFEDTKELHLAMSELIHIKKKYNKYKI